MPAPVTRRLVRHGVLAIICSCSNSRITSLAFGAAVVGALSLTPWSPRAANEPHEAHAAEPAHTARQEIAVKYVTVAEGSTARYRVRERLLGRELDNDAVGETSAITGTIALDKSGAVVRGASRFDVTLAGLTSDEARRDNYVRSRLLVTDSFPTTRLAVTGVRGLPSPLPTRGRVQFQLIGDLTVKGVTRPSSWNVTANVAGDQLTGTAATSFTFAEYQLTQPRVRVVLSVNDTIRLEYDFAMKKQTP